MKAQERAKRLQQAKQKLQATLDRIQEVDVDLEGLKPELGHRLSDMQERRLRALREIRERLETRRIAQEKVVESYSDGKS